MKLGATITSERGKAVTKTGNERIDVSINDEKGKVIGKLTVRYQVLNGSMQTHDNIEILFAGSNSGEYQVLKDTPVLKKTSGNLKDGKCSHKNTDVHIGIYERTEKCIDCGESGEYL